MIVDRSRCEEGRGKRVAFECGCGEQWMKCSGLSKSRSIVKAPCLGPMAPFIMEWTLLVQSRSCSTEAVSDWVDFTTMDPAKKKGHRNRVPCTRAGFLEGND